MAPPRQRPAAGSAIIDDSRSEASSGTATGHQSRGVPGPKPRKPAATSAGGATTSSKDLKLAALTGAAAAAAGVVGQNAIDYADDVRNDLPGVCSLSSFFTEAEEYAD